MSHLSTERLAALGDEEPTALEAAHLAGCAACERERAAYRTLVAMAGHERDAIGIPLTRWESIASALADERLAESAAVGRATRDRWAGVVRRGRTVRVLRTPMRAAAGFLLLAGGAIAGRVSAGADPLPLRGARSEASASAATQRLGAAAPTARVPDSVSFSSVEDARVTQLRSASLYQQAAVFLAEHDSTGEGDYNPEVVKSRLAALDQMISTTREAMREAPHDPVINGYYLTTLGQREATLRQLNTVMPASLRSNSF
jgi:hypothetical protein